MDRTARLSPAQLRALRWLADRGGHATLDRYGNAIARGEKAGYAAQTWLRLMISGHIARSPQPAYFGITQLGLGALD